MSFARNIFSAAVVGAGLVLVAAQAGAQAPAAKTPTPNTAPAAKPPAAAAPAAKPPAVATPAAPAAPTPFVPPIIPAAPTAIAPTAPAAPALPDVPAARLALARTVAKNAPSLGDYNGILPDIMQDTKTRLINLRPDQYLQISSVVESTASGLVARRNDLDDDVARVWARAFTDDELKAINAFFTSDAGKKYKMIAPQVGMDLVMAGQNWADRISGEMMDKSVAALKQQGVQF